MDLVMPDAGIFKQPSELEKTIKTEHQNGWKIIVQLMHQEE
jgi:hypothetical protein